ncbi:O-methyltransferase [Nocardia amamiensis]|uniref:O-methyltransferase n=1 Tax=Nocardia amamiensis TaxID=404578 RepID=UPI003F54235E
MADDRCRYWQRAGVADRIEVRIGDATETLEKMLADQGEASIDLAFIDADQANYSQYYYLVAQLVRPCGLILVDNTLFFGRVIDPDAQDRDTLAIREFNAMLRWCHIDPQEEFSAGIGHFRAVRASVGVGSGAPAPQGGNFGGSTRPRRDFEGFGKPLHRQNM